MKRTGWLGVIVAAAVLSCVAPAGAAVGTSAVTAPDDLSFPLYDARHPNTLAVAGTSDGSSSDHVDLRCYYGATSYLAHANVALGSDGGFGPVDVPLASMDRSGVMCVLRAVPAGTTPAAPPGTLSAFTGPRVGVGKLQDFIDDGVLHDYYARFNQSRGAMDYDSAGSCGLDDSYMWDPSTLKPSNVFFYCDDFLNWQDGPTSAQPDALAGTGSELRVDGSNAYVPGAIPRTFWGFNAFTRPGFQGITWSQTQDPATGNATITETDPVLKCSPDPDTWPPTASSCQTFVDAGVRIGRTIVQDHDGLMTRLSDRWWSTDGAAHPVDLMLENEVHGSHDTSFQFPWVSSSYATHTKGDTEPPPPSAPGTIYVKESDAAADNDPVHPRGAITFALPPAGFTFTTDESGNSGYSTFLAHYHPTVPATGFLGMDFTYSNAFAISEVSGFAAAAESTYSSTPTNVTITAPADGAPTNHPQVTLSGNAAALDGVASVVVNGTPGTVNPDGTWAATVPLQPGGNTLTAVATTAFFGHTAQAVTHVTYNPPAALALSLPSLSIVGSVLGSATGVSFTVACQAPAGSACPGLAKLTTVERLRGSKVLGLISAKKKKAKIKKKTVVVGSKSFSIPAGATRKLRVPLNATGKKLMAKFGKLPTKLTVTLAQPGGKQVTVTSRKLTLHAKKKKKKRKHH